MPDWLTAASTAAPVILGVAEVIRRFRQSVNASIKELASEIREEMKELASEMRTSTAKLASDVNSLGQRVARLEGIMQGVRWASVQLPADEGDATPP